MPDVCGCRWPSRLLRRYRYDEGYLRMFEALRIRAAKTSILSTVEDVHRWLGLEQFHRLDV